MAERREPSRWRSGYRGDVAGPQEGLFPRDGVPAENPYVGPWPFEASESDRFFGRGREIRKLASLVVARRVVLLYAQSGAGKTSLLQAGLGPYLEETKGYRVLPAGRVGGDLPPGIEGSQVGNLYALNTLLNMLGAEAEPQALQSLSLGEGLKSYFQIGSGTEQPVLLVLDQLEELFTSHPARHTQRAEFFRQLIACLDDHAHLSLVLALREDYLAQLDDYAGLMPDRLRARLRMERLGYAAALAAVEEPAWQAGRSFEAGVAESLVANLAGTEAGPEGSLDTEAPGIYVEPVHLQIVCHRLWERVPAGLTAIRARDVEEFGDVDEALKGLYEEALEEVVVKALANERRLRAWFAPPLITRSGTRGLVYRDEEKGETEKLPNEAVDLLYNAYLIRPVKRGRDTWYELAHDRLVAPIVEANRAWDLAQARLLPPRIEVFKVDRPAIRPGQQVTLTWQVEGADELTLHPLEQKMLLSGSMALTPAESTEYYLKAVKREAPVVTSVPQWVIVMETHLNLIAQGRATLIIGNALSAGRAFESMQSLIQSWADEVGYTPGGKADLAQVAQFIHITSTEPYAVQYNYLRFLGQRRERMIEENGTEDPFSILARLPIPIYLTTSPLRLLEDALRLAGKDPIADFCRWHDGLDGIPSVLQDRADFEPSVGRPLVYHFYGLDEVPESLVLSEDDHVGFMARVREDRDVVPIEVRQAMYRGYLLLLGYDWQSWEFRALLHGLLSRNTTRRPRGTFQADSSGERAGEIGYLVNYLSKYRLDIYWDDSQSFLRKLWREWGEVR